MTILEGTISGKLNEVIERIPELNRDDEDVMLFALNFLLANELEIKDLLADE